MTNKNLTDAKLKEYFDELWRQYQDKKDQAVVTRVPLVALNESAFTFGYACGERAGIDFAIETLKSKFELGEYAEGSEEK